MLSDSLLLVAARADFTSIEVPAWAWVAFVALLAVLLSIDLALHRGNHAPTARRALMESTAWVVCGLGFSVVVLVAWGSQAFGEYMSGYVIEKSLSIDNVFVWAIIFSTFAIPRRYQHRVLFWGIFGALTLRAVFIMGGSALITRFWWMLPVFGAVLVASGVKVVRHRDDEGAHGHDRAVTLLGRFVRVRPTLSGQRFVLREHGKLVATPLLAALVVIEVTDVVFAVDSVPAILAVSREPFIVFASNAFAILGLRAMYFLLGDAQARFHYLSHALGAILVFVGIKMALSHWWHLPTAASLAVILGILATAISFSARKQRADVRLQLSVSEKGRDESSRPFSVSELDPRGGPMFPQQREDDEHPAVPRGAWKVAPGDLPPEITIRGDDDPDAGAVPITWEGRRILAAKLRHLRDDVIPGLVARYESEHPGQPESAYVDDEYQDAAERLAHVCSLLARAHPAEATFDDPRVVELGETVTLFLDDGTLDRGLLVHPLEAPLGGIRVSSESPLGRALLGRGVGEEIEVRAPTGPYRCRILRAERPIRQGNWTPNSRRSRP